MDTPIKSEASNMKIAQVGRSIVFSGYVDDFDRRISSVQFSLDEGEHWTGYALQPSADNTTISWRFEFKPTTSGWHCLRVRAVDGLGEPSPLISSIPFFVMSEDAEIHTAYEKDNQPSPTALDAINHIHLRALSGCPIERAKVFRSGALSHATEADARLIQQLGIKTIYDIRTREETLSSPDPLISGVFTIALEPAQMRRRRDASKRLVAGVIGEYGRPEERMRANYRRYVQEYPLIGKALRSMADKGEPCLVHCESGKDRTGVICAVLQRVAGVAEDEILADYLAFNTLNADAIKADAKLLGEGMSDKEREILMSFLEARPCYLEEFFAEIDSAFGSFEAYVERSLKLSDAQIGSIGALVSGVA